MTGNVMSSRTNVTKTWRVRSTFLTHGRTASSSERFHHSTPGLSRRSLASWSALSTVKMRTLTPLVRQCLCWNSCSTLTRQSRGMLLVKSLVIKPTQPLRRRGLWLWTIFVCSSRVSVPNSYRTAWRAALSAKQQNLILTYSVTMSGWGRMRREKFQKTYCNASCW